MKIEKNSTIRGDWNSGRVWIEGRLLSPDRSQEIRNHSPDSFSWGYGGSGPAQLALALLLELTDEDFARANYMNFKWQVIAKLRQDDFELRMLTIWKWIERWREERNEDH